MNSNFITLSRMWAKALSRDITPSINITGCEMGRNVHIHLSVDTHTIVGPFEERIVVTVESMREIIEQCEAAIEEAEGMCAA